MNIMYVLFREDIFSPLVESQVLNNLYHIAKQDDVKIHFLWLKRIDYCFKYQKEIDKTKTKMIKNGIKLHEIPIIVGKFPLNKMMFDFVHFQIAKKISAIIVEYNIDIMHTRGYNAGLLVAKIKDKGIKFHHIFDPRSPYITEIESTYNIKPKTKIHNYWKENEEMIIKNSDITVSISENFSIYLKALGGNVIYIPNNADMDAPEEIYKRVIKQKRHAICFVGSLGYGWNNVIEYIKFMKNVLEIDHYMKFELYVLKASKKVVKIELENSGIPPSCYTIDTISPDKIGKTIAGCLAGLQIMSKMDNRLGIKTVDYMSAGVPVICNDNAVGAAKVVDVYQTGWNLSKIDIKVLLKEIQKNENISMKCIEVAYNNFSTKVISQKYYMLYKQLYNIDF